MTTTIGSLIDQGAIETVTGFASGEHNQEGVGVPHMRPFNVTPEGRVSLAQIKSVPAPKDSARLLTRGDLLFNNTNTAELVGKTAYWDTDERYAFSNHMTRVRVLNHKRVVPRYLALALHREWLAGQSQQLCRQHVAQASIIGERFRELTFELPTLATQQRIAAVLSLTQRAIETEENVIATTRELKSAAMRTFFDTSTGYVARDDAWVTTTLGKVARMERGRFMHRPRNEPRFYGGATPFVQTGDVVRSRGRIRTYSQTLNDDGVAISRVFPAGTILIAIAANIGYTGILEFKSACPDSLIAITPGQGVDVPYLNYYLQTQQPEMDRLAPKGTQKNINLQFLEPWPVRIPPLTRQREIASCLGTIDNSLSTREVRLERLRELFSSLLDRLMTGEISVDELEIDTSEVAAA